MEEINFKYFYENVAQYFCPVNYRLTILIGPTRKTFFPHYTGTIWKMFHPFNSEKLKNIEDFIR